MVLHTIIIGAGVGGLALAQGLKKAGCSFAIYERDAADGFRPQGYRLRINAEGSAALKENLTDDNWRIFCQSSAITAIGITNIDPISAEVTLRKPGFDPSRKGGVGSADNTYTCDRTVLRSVLMTGLDDVLHFGKVFTKYSILPSGKVRVEFADETTAEADFLVGADGLHSPVRRQYLPSLVFLDLGVRFIYGKTTITPELEAAYHKQGAEWITVASDQRPVTLFLEPVRFTQDPAHVASHLPHVSDYIYWILGSNQSHFPVEDEHLFSLSKEQIKGLSLSLTEKWHPSIRVLFEHQDTSQTSILRVSTAPLTIPSWTPSQVTLLGDACHAMPPYGGQGANSALVDALALTKVIIQGAKPDDIGQYEHSMIERAALFLKPVLDGPAKKMFGQVPIDQCKPILFSHNPKN